MLEALHIMQEIGVEYMLENGMEEALICKGIITEQEYYDITGKRYLIK